MGVSLPIHFVDCGGERSQGRISGMTTMRFRVNVGHTRFSTSILCRLHRTFTLTPYVHRVRFLYGPFFGRVRVFEGKRHKLSRIGVVSAKQVSLTGFAYRGVHLFLVVPLCVSVIAKVRSHFWGDGHVFRVGGLSFYWANDNV